jgi:hypothetical protein
MNSIQALLSGQMDCQHGFVEGRSTVSILLDDSYSSFVLKSIYSGYQVDSIYTVFFKVFHNVRHRLLLDKMSSDVEPSGCLWLGFYFSRRNQRIRICDCVSKDFLVTSSARRAEILGHFALSGL